MFRLASGDKVYWPVELASRGEDGEPVIETCHIGYKILTRDERRAYERMELLALENRGGDLSARLDALDSVATQADKLLRERIFDWKDIIDAEDRPVSFSPSVLEGMIGDDLLRKGLLKGLFEASRGARIKNSLPGPAGESAPVQSTTDAGSGISRTDGATSPVNTARTPAG